MVNCADCKWSDPLWEAGLIFCDMTDTCMSADCSATGECEFFVPLDSNNTKE